MTFDSSTIALISLLGAVFLAIDKWVHHREIKEINLKHQQEIDKISRLSENISLQERFTRLEKEVARLHDKASERHGEIQTRLGDMELKIRGFTSKTEAQMRELYHLVGSKRERDKS